MSRLSPICLITSMVDFLKVRFPICSPRGSVARLATSIRRQLVAFLWLWLETKFIDAKSCYKQKNNKSSKPQRKQSENQEFRVLDPYDKIHREEPVLTDVGNKGEWNKILRVSGLRIL